MPKILRQRADQLVFEQGLAESREQARRLIMAGKIALGPDRRPMARRFCRRRASRAGAQTRPPLPGRHTLHAVARRTLREPRGAYKLLTILDNFRLDVNGLVCLDAGASTGGFTDCLLQSGAGRVYAVDVGRNQLHENCALIRG